MITLSKMYANTVRTTPHRTSAPVPRKYARISPNMNNFIMTLTNHMSAPEKTAGTEFRVTFDQFYRVILYYTNWPEDSTKLVTTRVKMAVPMLTLNDCDVIVRQTFKYGMCIVCTVQHDKAVLYRDSLIGFGFNATIEEA